MDSITVDKARNLLLDGDARLVAQEQPRCYYDNYSGDRQRDKRHGSDKREYRQHKGIENYGTTD